MDIASLIAFANDKELFVLVYASAACDIVILSAVLAYFTFRNAGCGTASAIITGVLLLVILLVVFVLATLATYGHFAAGLRTLPSSECNRLNDLLRSPREQADVISSIQGVLSGIEAAFRAKKPNMGALRTLDGRIDDLNGMLADFPTFRNPPRELGLAAIVIGACLVVAGIAAVVAPAQSAGGTVVGIIVATAAATAFSMVTLYTAGALGRETIVVRRVGAEADWSKGDVRAAVIASHNSLGPAMNAFGVRTRVRLQSSEPVPEHRPFWAAAVTLLTIGCLVFAGAAGAAFNGMTGAYVPLLALSICVTMPSIAVFAAFFTRP